VAAYELLLLNTAVPQIQAAQSGDTYLCPRELAVVVNTATDAVRITQTGTGNALLVEDSANPDSTPFVVTAAGDVGIGTNSPGAKLSVVKAISAGDIGTSFQQEIVNNNSAGGGDWTGTIYRWLPNNANTNQAYIGAIVTSNAGDTLSDLVFGVKNSTSGNTIVEAMRISKGNLGLGVTPSASWDSIFKAMQIGSASYLSIAAQNTAAARGSMLWNAIGSGDESFVYRNTGDPANRFMVGSGFFAWYTAGTGTAGDPITFTQAMTLDASGNLGVGTTSPNVRLEVATSSGTAGQVNTHIALSRGTTNYAFLATERAAASNDVSALVFGVNSAERARITSGGDFQTSSGGSVQVGGTAPVGTLANGVSFYSTAGEARVMDAAGNATLLSPHDTETNEWIFHSKHTPTGKVLRIDVERLLKFVNDHFGLDAVHEFVEK